MYKYMADDAAFYTFSDANNFTAEEIAEAEKHDDVFFEYNRKDWTDEEWEDLEKKRKELRIEQIFRKPLVDIMVKCGMVPSKGEARRLIKGGAVYVIHPDNTYIQVRITDERQVMAWSVGDEFIVRWGKVNKMMRVVFTE